VSRLREDANPHLLRCIQSTDPRRCFAICILLCHTSSFPRPKSSPRCNDASVGRPGRSVYGGGIEREQGVLGEELDLVTWQRAQALMRRAEATVYKMLGLRLGGFSFSLPKAPAWMVGGNISVACRVSKTQQEASAISNSLPAILDCPNCENKRSLPLCVTQQGQGLQCHECDQFYPEADGMILMFENSLGRKLYPDLLSREKPYLRPTPQSGLALKSLAANL
jgi:uncharacterized protein YbaR (Trm112 family)